MHMRPARLALLSLLAAVSILPLAAATPVEGDLFVGGTTRVVGANGFVLESLGLLVQDGPAELAFELATPAGEAVLLQVQTQQLRTPAGWTDHVRAEERVVARAALAISPGREAPKVGFHAPAGLTAPVVRVLPTGAPLALELAASRELDIGATSPLEPAQFDTAFGSSPRLLDEPTRPGDDAAYLEGLPSSVAW